MANQSFPPFELQETSNVRQPYKLVRGKEGLKLSDNELKVLHLLLSRRGEVLTIDQVNKVWYASTASLQTAISRIRKCLRDHRNLIETVHGVGYRFTAQRGCKVTANSELAEKFRTLLWIAYSPSGHDERYSGGMKEEDIRLDLSRLYETGIRGLITFRSTGRMAEVPRIAKSEKFEAVIMGFSPDETDFVRVAKDKKDCVEAFCLGHNYAMDPEEQIRKMDSLGDATGKPISTTLYLGDYEDPSMKRIVERCDFLFPDVKVFWRDRYVGDHKALIKDIDEKAKRTSCIAAAHSTVALLKMISCPSGGLEGYTEREQERFFRNVLTYYCSRYSYWRSVSLSFYSAFDSTWKAIAGLSPCENHVGLFTSERQPKKAVALFNDYKEKLRYRARKH